MSDAPTAAQIARWERICARVGVFAPEACSFEDWARVAARWERQSAKHWLRHGPAGFTPGYPRPTDDALAAAAQELAMAPPEPLPAEEATEDGLIAAALAVPTPRSAR